MSGPFNPFCFAVAICAAVATVAPYFAHAKNRVKPSGTSIWNTSLIVRGIGLGYIDLYIYALSKLGSENVPSAVSGVPPDPGY